MEEKNININHHQPKDLSLIDLSEIDMVVNMSGRPFPMRLEVEVRDWTVEDPIGKEEEVYLAVREVIEMKVMRLILDLRRQFNPPQPRKRSKRATLNAEANADGAPKPIEKL